MEQKEKLKFGSQEAFSGFTLTFGAIVGNHRLLDWITMVCIALTRTNIIK